MSSTAPPEDASEAAQGPPGSRRREDIYSPRPRGEDRRERFRTAVPTPRAVVPQCVTGHFVRRKLPLAYAKAVLYSHD